jgi:hypothetical protein
VVVEGAAGAVVAAASAAAEASAAEVVGVAVAAGSDRLAGRRQVTAKEPGLAARRSPCSVDQ